MQKPKRRKPWVEAGMTYFDWCLAKERAAYANRAPWLALTASPAPAVSVVAKPELCALVETVQGGGKVIWLSEGFPVDRSRYGRIALERRQAGEP